MQVTFFLDVSALSGMEWTGIPEVTCQLARYLLRHHRGHCVFFNEGQNIDPRYVEMAVDRAPGGYLHHFIRSGIAVLGSLHRALAPGVLSVGLFPNIKPFHRVFDIEVLVAYDLSSMLMPELHDPKAAASHTLGLMLDCESSDLICCISAATRDDIELYLGVPRGKTFVSHLGRPALPPPIERAAAPATPYAVVIGTIEPRKNLRLVAELLRCWPELCEDLAFLFIGRRGWGPDFISVFSGVIDAPATKDRVVFTGYLPDATKLRLLQGARFSIYPSLFEGFGLPVLESMAAGCPIIASRTSSIVEMGLPEQCLFDPSSLEDFARAFRSISALSPAQRATMAATLRHTAEPFTWDAFSGRIIEAVQGCMSQRSVAAA